VFQIKFIELIEIYSSSHANFLIWCAIFETSGKFNLDFMQSMGYNWWRCTKIKFGWQQFSMWTPYQRPHKRQFPIWSQNLVS